MYFTAPTQALSRVRCLPQLSQIWPDTKDCHFSNPKLHSKSNSVFQCRIDGAFVFDGGVTRRGQKVECDGSAKSAFNTRPSQNNRKPVGIFLIFAAPFPCADSNTKITKVRLKHVKLVLLGRLKNVATMSSRSARLGSLRRTS